MRVPQPLQVNDQDLDQFSDRSGDTPSQLFITVLLLINSYHHVIMCDRVDMQLIETILITNFGQFGLSDSG